METDNKKRLGKAYLMVSGTLFTAGITMLLAKALKLNNAATTLLTIGGLTLGGFYTSKILE